MAHTLAAKSTRRPKRIDIRVDRSIAGPHEVWVNDKSGRRARFEVTPQGAREMAGVTVQENEVLTPMADLRVAEADHEMRRRRVVEHSGGVRSARKHKPAVKLNRQEQLQAQKRETEDLKRGLLGKPPAPSVRVETVETGTTGWKERADEDRRRSLEKIKEHRRLQRKKEH